MRRNLTWCALSEIASVTYTVALSSLIHAYYQLFSLCVYPFFVLLNFHLGTNINRYASCCFCCCACWVLEQQSFIFISVVGIKLIESDSNSGQTLYHTELMYIQHVLPQCCASYITLQYLCNLTQC
jgi:hypothetical protein